ncbi:MAG: hypothetical protein LAP85_25865 [Acidobacteriia bacterium]|nr:hypothetical protein [Terriglobia bacterium]
MPTNQELIAKAIKERLQIKAVYENYPREMCPHILGWKNGVMRVLSFQFGGSTSKGLPPGGDWKCMEVGKLMHISLQAGTWHAGSTGGWHRKPQTCIDQIIIQV